MKTNNFADWIRNLLRKDPKLAEAVEQERKAADKLIGQKTKPYLDPEDIEAEKRLREIDLT